MISSMFKTRKPKQFNFNPRHYNEAKEELNERIKDIKLNHDSENNSSEIRPSIGFKGQWKTQRKTIPQLKHNPYRLILIMGVLFIIAYYLLFR